MIKQAKQLKCDVNSKQFRDAMRYVWMPRLIERIRASSEYHPTRKPQNHLHPNGLLLLHQQQQGSEKECVNPNCSSSTSELQVTSNSDLSESSEIAGDPVGNGSVTQMLEQGILVGGGDSVSLENLWNDENIWFLRQQLSDEL